MNANHESATEQNPGEISSLNVLAARLTWVILGPLAILLIVFRILSGGDGWLTGSDALFGVVVCLMILGRWVEQRSGVATTLLGEPATAAQCKRYCVFLPLAAAALWVLANLLGNHVL